MAKPLACFVDGI